MNQLTNQMIAQLYCQNSDDPFLTLITLTHPSFIEPIRLVNNPVAIVSRGQTYEPFPVRITLPADDGETLRQAVLEFDNVSLELIGLIRSVADGSQIQVTLEMILASIPNDVQVQLSELKIMSISYNPEKISANLGMDDFLNTEISSERYQPNNFRGIF